MCCPLYKCVEDDDLQLFSGMPVSLNFFVNLLRSTYLEVAHYENWPI